ncbi:hypothetical protein TcasGA2_TC002606 [Tribolium castaneum]|uniref:Reverse transcriptase zinc-binding domain-containing protein n=1 Tax=Tribolium castaneum TaxID=7070 RepID=D6WFG2_TRICA|nr:hypothetical protein TcasGA2_TC002606 [Tribolium castaneum]
MQVIRTNSFILRIGEETVIKAPLGELRAKQVHKNRRNQSVNAYFGHNYARRKSVLSNIAPPALRRKLAVKKLWNKYRRHPQEYPIWSDLIAPENRLKSRKPFWVETFNIENFFIINEWRNIWSNIHLFNKDLIEDPSKRVPGMDQPRWVWVKLNRLRTGHARCKSMLFKWKATENPYCQCGHVEETIQHLVEECQITSFQGGFNEIHQLSPQAKTWLSTIKVL